MRTTALFIAACMIVGVTLRASAQTTPKVTERQKNQQARIKEGAKTGEQTKREVVKLETQQAKIRAEKKMAKTDGKVTVVERAKLQHDQNKASRHILNEKHNKQERK